MSGLERKPAIWGVCPGGRAVIPTVGSGRLPGTEPDAAEVNVGGGGPIQAEAWRNANANVLTDFYNRGPISGFPVFKARLCRIEKA